MRKALVLAWLLVAMLGALGAAQTNDLATATGDVADKALGFLHTAADLIGTGLVRLVNLVLPEARGVSQGLVLPLGYLGLLTLVLLLFGIVAAARKVIWLVVCVGWVLMIVRIVLDVLHVS